MIGADFAFLHPALLGGLLLLPLLWHLLRVTPPPPKRIVFPPARLFAHLHAPENAAQRTPWWILLLRLAAAACIIVALAEPVLHPATALPGSDPVRLVLDTGWAAAQNWDDERAQALSIVAEADREGRALYLLTTTPTADGTATHQSGPLSAASATSIIRALAPAPWPNDSTAAAKAVNGDATSFWLSSGLASDEDENLAHALSSHGALTVYKPAADKLPTLLRPANASPDLTAHVEMLPLSKPRPLTVQALGANGHIIDAQTITVPTGKASADVALDLPSASRNQVQQLRLGGAGAGNVVLLDDADQRRLVGIMAAGNDSTTPLTDADFYLKQALAPSADVITGAVRDLLARKPAVIVLPDVAALPADDLDALQKWVNDGGLLLRFAGPNMTQAQPFLVPVNLRAGGRALDGAMTWTKPQAIAPFPANGPFAGLDVPNDVTVSRQLLAEPQPGLAKLTWASLTDGTPLVTAAPMGRGLLVLVHTTATPQWSNLCLSGLFVQVLRRTINMAGESVHTNDGNGILQPRVVLDGFGALQAPGAHVRPLTAAESSAVMPSSAHPPGIYERSGNTVALNLGALAPALRPIAAPGADQVTYGAASREISLLPWLLATAFVLFLIDWIVTLSLSGALRRLTFAALTLVMLAAPSAHADSADDVHHASNLYLAYVETGDASTDQTSNAGLSALATILNQRTSVEAAGVAGVDPEKDDLSFYPLLYWPVRDGQTLSPAAARNVQNYLDHGGTILYAENADDEDALRKVSRGLNIPPLVQLPANHVLTRTYYLLRDFPARYDEGSLWLAQGNGGQRDGVAPVIIAGHDWAADWAGAAGGSVNGEMGLRFGVNLVMYTLTGSYKDDQIHLQEVMKRMAQ